MVTPHNRLSTVAASALVAALVVSLAPPSPAGAAAPMSPGADVRAAAPPQLTITGGGAGGELIPASTARYDGSGAWTEIRGIVLTEVAEGALEIGAYVRLALPLNFEFDHAVIEQPAVTGCDRKSTNISYPASRVASIRIDLNIAAMVHGPCRIAFGTLRVRPVSGTSMVKRGEMIVTVYASGASTTIPGSAGLIVMVVMSWTWPTLTRATGGDAIPRTTAGIGGTGAWTTLTGPVIGETMTAQIPPGLVFRLTIPDGFEWDEAVSTAPVVTGCDRMASPLAYNGQVVAFTILFVPAPAAIGRCRIDLGTTLRLRPVDAAATEGAEGPLGLAYDAPGMTGPVPFPGIAGWLAAVASPPPAVDLTLAAVAPTAINGAILWGEGVDLVTTGPVGTGFSLQVTTDGEVWETLKDATGTPLALTIGADGRGTYRYRPVRNYWYRAVAGSATSPVPYPRVTVRQTIVIRPIHDGTRHVATGTAVTFTATVRPAGPALPVASVRFELYRRTGSRWVLSRSVAVAVDISGVAATTFTFSSGRWYVRAQAQPTRVNANSLWTPSQHYTAD